MHVEVKIRQLDISSVLSREKAGDKLDSEIQASGVKWTSAPFLTVDRFDSILVVGHGMKARKINFAILGGKIC